MLGSTLARSPHRHGGSKLRPLPTSVKGRQSLSYALKATSESGYWEPVTAWAASKCTRVVRGEGLAMALANG